MSLIRRAEGCVKAEDSHCVPASSVNRLLKTSCASNSLRGHLQTYIRRNGDRDIVDIATRHGSVFEPWQGRYFPHPSRQDSISTQPPIQWVPVPFLRVSGRGVALTTNPSRGEVKERVEQ